MQKTLYLIPAPLDFGCQEQVPIKDTLPEQTIQKAAQITNWICENAKTTRAFLNRINQIAPLKTPIQQQTIIELPREIHKKGDHDKNQDINWAKNLITKTNEKEIGLISEAGMPAIADPGAAIVRAAHEMQITVIPLTGPISLMLALAASGFGGQNFAFNGYLPKEKTELITKIKELETKAQKTGQTQIFIEVPHRNQAMLQTLLQTLKPKSKIAVCAGLTLNTMQIQSMSCEKFKQTPLKKQSLELPAVFLIS